MLTAPVPSAAETRANATYAALMWAMARPGIPRTLPEEGEAVIAETLLDRECRVFCSDPDLAAQVVLTGAEIVPLARADHAFFGTLADTAPLREAALGTDLHPEEGATLVIRAAIGSGATLRLAGPGIETALDLRLGGLPDGFWARRAECIRYPLGFDLFVIDGDRVIGIPRSTRVEVN